MKLSISTSGCHSLHLREKAKDLHNFPRQTEEDHLRMMMVQLHLRMMMVQLHLRTMMVQLHLRMMMVQLHLRTMMVQLLSIMMAMAHPTTKVASKVQIHLALKMPST